MENFLNKKYTPKKSMARHITSTADLDDVSIGSVVFGLKPHTDFMGYCYEVGLIIPANLPKTIVSAIQAGFDQAAERTYQSDNMHQLRSNNDLYLHRVWDEKERPCNSAWKTSLPRALDIIALNAPVIFTADAEQFAHSLEERLQKHNPFCLDYGTRSSPEITHYRG
jgi:hypothetical protein